MSENQNEEIVYYYIKYIAAYIRLFASMCRGNNRDNKEYIVGDEIGLDWEFCKSAIFNEKLSTIVKNALLEFFQAAFVDITPLERL